MNWIKFLLAFATVLPQILQILGPILQAVQSAEQLPASGDAKNAAAVAKLQTSLPSMVSGTVGVLNHIGWFKKSVPSIAA